MSEQELADVRASPEFKTWIAEVPDEYRQQLTSYIDALAAHVSGDI
jgi:hypothetical protein